MSEAISLITEYTDTSNSELSLRVNACLDSGHQCPETETCCSMDENEASCCCLKVTFPLVYL